MTVKVLFVCMGNICRSPTAEGVFTAQVAAEGLAEHIQIDSAGTHAYHIGKAPDARSQEAAKRRGIDISHQRARRVEVVDFERFDYIIAMDEENLENLLLICPPGFESRAELFMAYAPHFNSRSVPDPYYGGLSGFERVLDMVEAASAGLLDKIRREHF